ncbi:hypothetical protein [Sporosarcina sp. A2]
MTREMERQVVISQLNQLGIFETMQNRKLETLTYDALVSLLSIERAMRS